ncbi:CHAT domain-containing protein [Streptomyces sp. NPDC002688]|uniref:CHAT domain-containing tetratricopeptide repeat protein n=1 Tax=Streptomyces sp. NPDC002688 TaxID=3154423 RepID=UPI003331C929
MDEPLARAVDARINAYLKGIDQARVLDDQALVEADALLQLTSKPVTGNDAGALDVDAVHSVAWLRWCRYHARVGAERAGVDGQDDFDTAVRLFSAVRPLCRGWLPDEMTELLDHYDRSRATERLFLHAVGDPRPDHVDEAVTALGEAVELAPLQYVDLTPELINLSMALRLRFQLSNDPGDLHAATEAVGFAVELLTDSVRPAKDPSAVLAAATSILAQYAEVTRDPADLDRVIDVARIATSTGSDNIENRILVRRFLALSLWARHGRSQSPADLDDMIAAMESWHVALPEGSAERSQALPLLADALLRKAEHTPTAASLDRAVDAARSAVAATEEADQRQSLLAGLSDALWLRAQCGSDDSDLAEVVSLRRGWCNAAAPESSEHGRRLSALGIALRQCAETHQDAAVLEEAVSCLREALALAADRAERDTRSVNLANALGSRAEELGNLGDALEALEILTDIVGRTRADDPQLPSRLSNQAMAHRQVFKQGGDKQDIDNAVDIALRSLESPSATPTDRSILLHNLSQCLYDRFVDYKKTDDLLDAISTGGEAVALAPVGSRHWYRILSQYVKSLLARFLVAGVSGDLSDAGAVVDRLRSQVPPDSPEQAHLLNLTAELFMSSYMHTDQMKFLERALEFNETALSMTGRHEPSYRTYSILRAFLLAMRAEAAKVSTGLDEAIARYEEAVAALDGPLRSHLMRKWGEALRARWEIDGNPSDLDHAVELIGRAASADGSLIAETHLLLAQALSARFQRDRDESDAQAAVEAWRTAVEDEASPTRVRLHAGYLCAVFLSELGRWPQALEFYRAAIRLLPLATGHGLAFGDQISETMTWSGLARDAAACALQCGDAIHAIELLEHGRSVLWSRVSGYRTDLRALFAVAPELAGEVERVRRGLDLRSTSRLADLGAARDDVGAGTGERLRLAEGWQDLIRRVKQIPGFEEFLEPPSFAALAPTDLPGPVVVINVSRFRCDALVVKAGHVRVISLPGLDQNRVIGHANRYFEALRAYFDAETRDPLLAVDMEQRLSDVLEWMWDEVMEPIVSDLTAQTPSSATQRIGESISRRVWWCPTGPLAVLPLHAAGHHDPSGPPGRAVIDHVVSSYVVSLRAFGRSQETSGATRAARLLMVALPETPEAAELAKVRDEVATLRRLLPRRKLHVLENERASRQAVTKVLDRYTWAHFSCHGRNGLSRDTLAAIRLHDGWWTVEDAAAMELRGAELAVLSVCDTALGGARFLDEAVHMAGALQVAGYRHVVGTLWAIYDGVAATVSGRLYQRIATRRTIRTEDTATALHDVIRSLRASSPYTPSEWAAFIHLGP